MSSSACWQYHLFDSNRAMFSTGCRPRASVQKASQPPTAARSTLDVSDERIYERPLIGELQTLATMARPSAHGRGYVKTH